MSPANPTFSHLEDFCEDIIAKAQDGLKMTNRELADQGGVDLSEVKNLKAGNGTVEGARAVAAALGLDPVRLTASFEKSWMPRPVHFPGLRTFVSEFRSMTVNAYTLRCPDGGCLLIDTGVDPTPILEHLRSAELDLRGILLTHAHPDHVAALPHLRKAWPEAPVFIHPNEDFSHAEPVSWDSILHLGGFEVRTLRTPGHTPGGTSFRMPGTQPSICFVGDALFAGSVGGCAADYGNALAANREKLLSLPGDTVLCPGHGPLTTVEEENRHNPFFS